MREGLALRAMRPDEIDAVALVWWRSSVSVAGGAEHPPSQALAERLRRERWVVTIAEHGGKPVALLAIDMDQRWLRQLFVDPQAQRLGVGSALLDEAKRQLPEGFHLHTNAENIRARTFYEARGLRLSGEAPHPQWGQLQARYEWEPSMDRAEEA